MNDNRWNVPDRPTGQADSQGGRQYEDMPEPMPMPAGGGQGAGMPPQGDGQAPHGENPDGQGKPKFPILAFAALALMIIGLTAVLVISTLNRCSSQKATDGTEQAEQTGKTEQGDAKTSGDENETTGAGATDGGTPTDGSDDSQMSNAARGSLAALEDKLDKMEESVPVGANQRSAATSERVISAVRLGEEMRSRGFLSPYDNSSPMPMEASCKLDGTYIGSDEVDYSSEERFPSYTGFWQSPAGVLWTLYVNEGYFMAVPIMSADSQPMQRRLCYAEGDYTIQYNVGDNTFSDFDRESSAISGLTLVRVDRLDAAAIGSLTVEQLMAV